MSRQVTSLIERVFEEYGVHLQLEEIAGGSLLFFHTREDLEKTIQLLETFRASLPNSFSYAGAISPWELLLLKPTLAEDARPILQICRDEIRALFGPQSAAEIVKSAVRFQVPGALKSLQVLWEYYLASSKKPGSGVPVPP